MEWTEPRETHSAIILLQFDARIVFDLDNVPRKRQR
jgi:hypothetical protein